MLGTARSLTLAGHTVPLAPRAAISAVVREAVGMPRSLQLWFGFLLAILGLAVPAALVALPPGWEVLGTSPTF